MTLLLPILLLALQQNPDVVVDPAGTTAFVPGAKGGLDAVDLANGRLLWHSDDANRPFVVEDRGLIGWSIEKANRIRIVVLDPAMKGKLVSRSGEIEFPGWVRITGGMGYSFHSTGKMKGDLFRLEWVANQVPYGGPRPHPNDERYKSAKGVVRVDMKTGKVRMLGADEDPLPKRPANVGPRAWRAGDRFVELSWKNAAGKRKLSLKRWEADSGKELEPVELIEGVSLMTSISADGRHLFVRKFLRDGYDVRVFEAETGKRVASTKTGTGGMPVLFTGGRILSITQGKAVEGNIKTTVPRFLESHDAKAGKVIWTHAVPPRVMHIPPPAMGR